MAIVGYVDLDTLEKRLKPAPMSGRTQCGYGKKIPTDLMVKLKGRWRRVYCAVFSNAPTSYILSGKDWIVVR
mgnify:CR=1 FL=1